MAAFARVTERVRLGPDVHLHELPQPGLPGEGRRHLRHRLRRPRRDGHRRRLVRARVAGLRLRLPAGPERLGHARRGRADHAAGLDHRAPRRWPASTTRSTAPSSGRCRCRRAGSRCGSPAAARRSRCGSPRSTRSTPTSTARWRASRASRSCCAGTARASAPTSTRSSARPTTTSRSAATRPRCEERMQDATGAPRAVRRRGPGRGIAAARSAGCRHAAPPSRSSRTCVRWRRRA